MCEGSMLRNGLLRKSGVILAALVAFATLNGCRILDPGGEITSFSFLKSDNAGVLSEDVIATIDGEEISTIVPCPTDVTSLKARFTYKGTSVSVGDVIQTSGMTPNNFTGAVVYQVKAGNGSTKDYSVTVTAEECITTEITAFSFEKSLNTSLESDATGVINGGAITVPVPYGIDVTSLIATISHTGDSLLVGDAPQVSGVSANNFSGNVSYTVKSADGTSRDYTVSVINTLAMVAVPGGTFDMGDEVAVDFILPTLPVHSVKLDNYLMGKYEVSYLEWSAVREWAVNNEYALSEGHKGSNNSLPENHTVYEPVTCVNWYDVIKWCNAASEKEGLTPVYYTDETHSLVYRTGETDITIAMADWTANGYRLPTEAEWEYAARMTSAGFSPGDQFSGFIDPTSLIGEYAWYVGNSGSLTKPVGTKLPNYLLIHDMSGNVFEWCWDWHEEYMNASPFTDDNTKGPASSTLSRRVIRGGCYSNGERYLKTSERYAVPPYRNDLYFYGFRVSRNNP
jgi:formylglycine-generating enzyme required for sulfatase activity